MADTTVVVGPVLLPDALEPVASLHPLMPPIEFLADTLCPYCGHPLVGGGIRFSPRGLAHAGCGTD
ncbi:MAG: hypothetical protein E6J88_10750 [Deltaproteobacteria bacterium]|nr:MAG: hypothetical protein E6J88_10750 [Deltaproteobacteria bacterium]